MQTLVVLTLRSIIQVTFPCGTCFLLNSSATIINSDNAALLNKNKPSSTLRNSALRIFCRVVINLCCSILIVVYGKVKCSPIVYRPNKSNTKIHALSCKFKNAIMKRILIYIFFSFWITSVIAQEQFVEKRAKFITKFPFKQLSGGVIVVQARLNNIVTPLNFILDTGSGGISLDSATCAEFQIPHSPSGRTINGIAGIREVDFARNNTLVLPGLRVEGLDFYINDYGILSNVYGEKIDGIIGYSFFSRYIVKVNYDSVKIEVFEPGSIRYPSGGYLLRPLFTTLPIQSLTLKDSRLIEGNFYIDTGAGLSFFIK
jgi:hypothetical protein